MVSLNSHFVNVTCEKPPQAPPKEGMSLSKAFKLRGRQLPWIPMFRKELCVPSAFCAIRVFCVKK